jgi:hypothetical protein
MRTIGDRVLMLQPKPHHVSADVNPARTIENFSLVPIAWLSAVQVLRISDRHAPNLKPPGSWWPTKNANYFDRNDGMVLDLNACIPHANLCRLLRCDACTQFERRVIHAR